MVTVKIPECSNPFEVTVNGRKYIYEAGIETDVPDDVAKAIEKHHKEHKKEAPKTVAPFGGGGVLHPLTLTGAVEAEYDGSQPLSVEIPKGGEWKYINTVTVPSDGEDVSSIVQMFTNDEITEWDEIMLMCYIKRGSSSTTSNGRYKVIFHHKDGSSTAGLSLQGLVYPTSSSITLIMLLKTGEYHLAVEVPNVSGAWGNLNGTQFNAYFSRSYGYSCKGMKISGITITPDSTTEYIGAGATIEIWGRHKES